MSEHHGESADDRDGHGDQRNERRAEFAEEQEHDDADEHESLAQRAHDLLDRRVDEDRGVEEDRVGEIVRKALGELVHRLRDRLRHLDRIGPGD